MGLFYDNSTDHIPPLGELRPVERVYAIRFSQFTDDHWQRLAEIYPTLQEWAGQGNLPYWFGPRKTRRFFGPR